jgi:hypothetical protein
LYNIGLDSLTFLEIQEIVGISRYQLKPQIQHEHPLG